jgi:hypothetical protein
MIWGGLCLTHPAEISSVSSIVTRTEKQLVQKTATQTDQKIELKLNESQTKTPFLTPFLLNLISFIDTLHVQLRLEGDMI